MSKYAFQFNQRYAVFKAFNGQCEWCKEPVDFKTFHVDHVLPEELLGDAVRLKAVLQTYGLDDNFNINDYENWVPSHSYCNQGKSDKVYEGLGIIKTILDKCEKNKELEQRIELKLKREPKKVELLATVQAAIERNLVNLADLQTFLIKTDIMDSDDEELKKLAQTVEQKLEYQTDKMLKGIIDLLMDHTKDVVDSIASALGKDWYVGVPVDFGPKPHPAKYNTRYVIGNRVNDTLSVSVGVNADFNNNQLIVHFTEGRNIIGKYVADIRESIDWEGFRTVLKDHHKDLLKQKAK